MAKFVYITNGMASTLNSSFELSRRLVSAGHEVIYLSHLDLSSRIEAQGHPFVQLTECQKLRREFSDYIRSMKPGFSPKKITDVIRVARSFRNRSIGNPEIENTIRRLAPQMLIIDIEMHYAVLASLNLGIPIALPIVWFSVFRNPDLPPLNTLLQPGNSRSRSLQIRLAWWRLLIGRRLSFFLDNFRLASLKNRLRPVAYDTNRRVDLMAIARAHSVNFKRQTDWTHWLRPHLYPELDVLCMNAVEFDFPHQPPPCLAYVGPMVHENREETNVSSDARQQWETMRTDCQIRGRSIIYCSLGTYWSTDTALLERIIQVFERRPEWGLVIGLGGKMQRDQLRPVPENVLLMDFAPQLEILKTADVAITHGGITSINECIEFEVPMLVCSTGHVDQDGCSARIAYHQLGLTVDIKSASPELIECQIAELIQSDVVRGNVQRMKKSFQRYRDDRIVESLLESMIRDR